MNYLAVSHTLAKYNKQTNKWDMEVSLSLNKPYVKMEFDTEEDATAFICEEMKKMNEKTSKNRRAVIR